MNKIIETPFFDNVREIWDKGIKVLDFQYKKAVLGVDISQTPKCLVPKWEVSNQKAFATNLKWLFEEIASNLDECKAVDEMTLERYLFSLLQPFKEYADILNRDNLNRTYDVDGFDGVGSYKYWNNFDNWVWEKLQRFGLTDDNEDDEVFRGCCMTLCNLWDVTYMYANMLDAVLLERGIDLKTIQNQVGVTLLTKRDLTQIGHYLGTPERAKTLISKFATEPQQEHPEPQPEQPKPTRGKGRPKGTLKNKMVDDADGSKLQKMHTKLDGKRGKDVSLMVLACIKKGWLTKPTYTQVKNEFGDIGSKTGYNKYLSEQMFTKEELEGAINSLD